MGLDMYLTAEQRMYPEYEGTKRKTPEKAKKVREIFPELENFETGNLDYTTVKIEAGYWRKANHIHNWFVENIQDGKDNCNSYYVSRKQLQELLSICKKIKSEIKLVDDTVVNGFIANNSTNGELVKNLEQGKVILNPEICEKLLPTTKGFFFGSTNYDQWYMQDVEDTIKIMERCLALPEKWDFEYHSSW